MKALLNMFFIKRLPSLSITLSILNIVKHCLPVHLAGLHHGEHGLTHVEGVAPVVVLHWPVVLLHAQRPPTHNLPTCE